MSQTAAWRHACTNAFLGNVLGSAPVAHDGEGAAEGPGVEIGARTPMPPPSRRRRARRPAPVRRVPHVVSTVGCLGLTRIQLYPRLVRMLRHAQDPDSGGCEKHLRRCLWQQQLEHAGEAAGQHHEQAAPKTSRGRRSTCNRPTSRSPPRSSRAARRGATITVHLKNTGSNPHTFTQLARVDEQLSAGESKDITVTLPCSRGLWSSTAVPSAEQRHAGRVSFFMTETPSPWCRASRCDAVQLRQRRLQLPQLTFR